MPLEIDLQVEYAGLYRVLTEAEKVFGLRTMVKIARYAAQPVAKKLRSYVRGVEDMSRRARGLAGRTIGVNTSRGVKVGFVKRGNTSAGLSGRNIHWWVLGTYYRATKRTKQFRGRIRPHLQGLLERAVSDAKSEVLARAQERLEREVDRRAARQR